MKFILNKIKKLITDYIDFITLILIIIGLLITLYFIGFKLTSDEKTTVNILSIIGTFSSIFGLAITLMQIIALKEISLLTQSTIAETKDKLMLGISISDVTEAIKLISEIDNFLGNQKNEIARSKIIDLKEKLIQFRSSKEFQLIIQDNKIKEIIDMLNIQISILYNVIYSDEDIKYNTDEIITQLQEISTYLTDFRNKIKYQTV